MNAYIFGVIYFIGGLLFASMGILAVHKEEIKKEQRRLGSEANPVVPLVWQNPSGVWFQRGVKTEEGWNTELWRVESEDGKLSLYGVNVKYTNESGRE